MRFGYVLDVYLPRGVPWLPVALAACWTLHGGKELHACLRLACCMPHSAAHDNWALSARREPYLLAPSRASLLHAT